MNTLVGSGFHVQNVTSKPSYLLLRVYKVDEFGIHQRYVLAFSGQSVLNEAAIAGLQKVSANDDAPLVIIGAAEGAGPSTPVVTLEQFIGRMGGSIPSFLPLEPNFLDQITQLGFNKKPSGLVGKADDLFEAYVHAGLQFILQRRVIRYGQDRRFEVVSDGLVLSRDSVQLLYDCKAYEKGYPISRDSIRQFADYIRLFHDRYENYVGRIHSFLLISGSFKSDSTLMDRANELYAECKVPLVFMTAKTLGEIVQMLANAPQFRGAIDWKQIFSSTIIDSKDVGSLVRARKKDKVIGS